MKNTLMNLINKRNIFVGLAMVLAFMIVKIIGGIGIFVGDTPTVSPDYRNPAYIASIPGRILAGIGERISDPFGQRAKAAQQLYASIPQAQPPAGLLYQSVARGVFAAEQNGQKYYKIEKGAKVEIRIYTLKDGRQIKVIVPLEK